MKNLILIFLLFLAIKNASSQDRFNILCHDFTFQEKESKTGRDLKQAFEVVISGSNYPFRLIDRENLKNVFATLQEEKNLHEDFSNEFNKKLLLAGVEYFVRGNMDLDVGTGNYKLLIFFIKVTGKNVTEKLPLLITLSREDLSNTEMLKVTLNKELITFTNTYFIRDEDPNAFVKIPVFYREMDKRDSIIKTLQTNTATQTNTINSLGTTVFTLQNEIKDKSIEIKVLNINIENVKAYSYMATLSVWGSEYEKGGGIIVTSQISLLMEKILKENNNITSLKEGDSTLIYINQVTAQYPKFPFGHWAKAEYLRSRKEDSWVASARKCIEILKITTSIGLHHPNHDQALIGLRNFLLSDGYLPD